MYFDTPHEKHYVLLTHNLEEVHWDWHLVVYLRELESFLDMLAHTCTHMVDNYFLPNNE